MSDSLVFFSTLPKEIIQHEILKFAGMVIRPGNCLMRLLDQDRVQRMDTMFGDILRKWELDLDEEEDLRLTLWDSSPLEDADDETIMTIIKITNPESPVLDEYRACTSYIYRINPSSSLTRSSDVPDRELSTQCFDDAKRAVFKSPERFKWRFNREDQIWVCPAKVQHIIDAAVALWDEEAQAVFGADKEWFSNLLIQTYSGDF